MVNNYLITLNDADLKSMLYDIVDSALKNNPTFQPSQPQQETDKPLSVVETAKFLDLAVPTIYGLVFKKQISHVKRGGKLYFFRADLLQWLQDGKQKTAAEIETEAEQHLLTQLENSYFQQSENQT